MDVVTLTSGGLDSTLMALLIKEQGLVQQPLFIDYGQLNKEAELAACQRNMIAHGIPAPTIMPIAGFGSVISSGLTDRRKRTFEDAFLPGRNLLFLLAGASVAYQLKANAVAIGLLTEEAALFPDQTKPFLNEAQHILSRCLDRPLSILAPFLKMTKRQVYEEATNRGITGTYSCHRGGPKPCGSCIACREYNFLAE